MVPRHSRRATRETDLATAASLPPLRAEPPPGLGPARDSGPGVLVATVGAGHPAPVHLDPDHRGDEDALHALDALVEQDLAACNRTIVARMDSPVALIPQLAAHIVAAGGKRLRPLLTLSAARLCGYTGTRHTSLAACVEFIHTATLLHDDVVDESALRRGLASANAVFGNKASVLVGDFLFSRAFQLMVEDGSLKVLEILSRAAATIAEGEVLQLVTQNDLATTEDRYLEVIKGKTAALFAAACEVGAIVADGPSWQRDALRNFGTNLGIAFQLADDALDGAARNHFCHPGAGRTLCRASEGGAARICRRRDARSAAGGRGLH